MVTFGTRNFIVLAAMIAALTAIIVGSLPRIYLLDTPYCGRVRVPPDRLRSLHKRYAVYTRE